MSPWEVDPIAVAAGDLSRPEREAAERLLRDDAAFRAEVDRAARVTGALAALPADAWTASAPPPPPLDLGAALAARPAGAAAPAPVAPPSSPVAPPSSPGAPPSHGASSSSPLASPAPLASPSSLGPPPPHTDGRQRRWPGGIRPRRGPGSQSRRAPRVVVLRPLTAALAGLALLAAGAGGAAMLGLGEDGGSGLAGTNPTAGAAPARVVVLEPLAPVATGRERARVGLPARAGGSVRVALDGLAPLGRGEYLELWLLRDGEDMVSLGTFRAGADGRVRVALPVGVDPAAARFVDVSVERDDGDPAHSGRSVLRSSALS